MRKLKKKKRIYFRYFIEELLNYETHLAIIDIKIIQEPT